MRGASDRGAVNLFIAPKILRTYSSSVGAHGTLSEQPVLGVSAISRSIIPSSLKS
jgi:hypothetical protein